jgi:hypothetical protein
MLSANYNNEGQEPDLHLRQKVETGSILAIHAPMINTAPYVKFWMRADPLLGQVGGSWALRDFFGPCEIASSSKVHR